MNKREIINKFIQLNLIILLTTTLSWLITRGIEPIVNIVYFVVILLIGGNIGGIIGIIILKIEQKLKH